jgi:hypothetical protein
MKIELPHPFTKEEATARLKALTDYWDVKHGIRGEWQGSSAKIKGKVKLISFDGSFTLEDRRMLAEVKVSFGGETIGRPYIERKLAEYLDPKNTLESLQARVPR